LKKLPFNIITMDILLFLKLFCGKPGVTFILCFFTYFFAFGNSQLFSINPSVYEEKFNLDDLDIRLFLMYPSVTCILFSWPIFNRIREGNVKIRYWLIVFCGCTAFGSTLRMIPLYTSNSQTWIFHIAQLIIPFGLLSNALATQIAAVWFPPKFRGLMTSLVVIGGALGAATLKTFGAMVTTNISDASRMFYFEAIAAVTLFFAVVLFCPDEPTNSNAQNKDGYKQLDSGEKVQLGNGVLLTLVSIALLRGVKDPMFGNMTALLLYDNIDNEDAAYISSIQGYTPVFGALFLGFIMKSNRLRAERRAFLIIGLFLYCCITILFSLSFTSYFWPTPPLVYKFLNSMLIQAFAGIIWGFSRSLTHEYIAELSYPAAPMYFGLWMEFGKNCVNLCVLAIPSDVAYKFIFEIMSATAFMSALLISCTPPRRRFDLINFNEDHGYGSSVYINKKAIKGRPVVYVKD